MEIPLIRAPTQIPNNVINIFTDGSKIGGKVGAAAVIIKGDIVLHQSKYGLHERCSNNQAEQVAILKALEHIQNLHLAEDAENIVLVNTDSKVTLGTLNNRNKHYMLMEIKRMAIKKLEDQQWTMVFNWVKAHIGIEGNEMADRLAKKASTDNAIELVYNKIPRETIMTEGQKIEMSEWQEQWTSSTKAAVSKLFFPYINERIMTVIPISAEFRLW